MREFRYDLNGLKAIAITAIVLYHFNDLSRFSRFTDSTLFMGGFLGVDIFLIISGYLITLSIWPRLQAQDFSLKAFYQSRLLRIMPPLTFMMLSVMGLGFYILFPDVYKELGKEVINTVVPVGNYRLANSGGYFSLASADRVLLHSWYLCITLQFYLLYPLLLLLIKKLRLNPLYALNAVFFGSLASALIFTGDTKGYLLTHCRIFELFLGSVLYLAQDRISRHLSSTAALALKTAGIVLIVYAVFTVKLENGIWHVSDSLPVIAGTALTIMGRTDFKFLNIPLLNETGRISYSLYLWHWPMMVFAFKTFMENSTSYILLLFSAIIAVSALSYLLLEKRRYRRAIIIFIFVFTVVTALHIIRTDGKNYLSDFMVPEASRSVNTSEHPGNGAVALAEEDFKVLRYGPVSVRPHLFVIGDSHADHYTYFFRNVANIPVYMLAWHANMSYGHNMLNLKKTVIVSQRERIIYHSLYKKMLDLLEDGDKVILANRWDIHFDYYALEYSIPYNRENFQKYMQLVAEDLSEEIDSHPKLRFFIVGEGIITSSQVANCLKTDLKGLFLSRLMKQDKCRSTANYLDFRFDVANSVLRNFAEKRSNVVFIDRTVPLKISENTYRTYDDEGLPLYYDEGHYSSAGGILVGRYIMQIVNQN